MPTGASENCSIERYSPFPAPSRPKKLRLTLKPLRWVDSSRLFCWGRAGRRIREWRRCGDCTVIDKASSNRQFWTNISHSSWREGSCDEKASSDWITPSIDSMPLYKKAHIYHCISESCRRITQGKHCWKCLTSKAGNGVFLKKSYKMLKAVINWSNQLKMRWNVEISKLLFNVCKEHRAVPVTFSCWTCQAFVWWICENFNRRSWDLVAFLCSTLITVKKLTFLLLYAKTSWTMLNDACITSISAFLVSQIFMKHSISRENYYTNSNFTNRRSTYYSKRLL